MSESLGPRPRRGVPIAAAWLFAGWALFATALLATGCTQSTAAKSQTQHRKPPRTAMEVLDQMVEAYHQADRYQDDGRLLVRYTYDGQEVTETKEFSLAIAAPNRMRLRAYDALVVCDGQNLRGTIDESPEEVFSTPAPDELTAASPYQDSVLGKALNQIVGSVPVTLFLDPDPLPLLLVNARKPTLESSQKIGDDVCYRVRIERREGAFVLWIDKQTLVVRRVEYPTDGYRRLVEPYPGVIRDMTITAELENARLDPPIDDSTFEFQVPHGASLVRRFDDVRVGARIPKFKLRALDGRQITRDSLEGKIAVIKFWQRDDVLAYYNDLSSFAQIQKHYANDDSIVFLAVTADPDEISDDDLRAALAKAELSLPVARADYRVAFRSFGLQIVPTTVILGRDGMLQERIVGVYPKQAAALVKKLDILLAGGDLTLEAHEEPPEEFSFSGFDWTSAPGPEEERQAAMAAALNKAQIAPLSEPKLLRRKRLWACSELQQPGNLLVVPDDSGSDRVFVIEGWPSVAEIGSDGKLSARHKLKLPQRDDASVTLLRTAADGAGNRYFVGSRPGAQQLHLFDAGWKHLLSFPKYADHPGIADALLADLDGDGELEMAIGYVEAVGVHCVTLDGQRLWRNPVAESVLRLDVSGPDRRGRRQLLATDGLIVPIDAEGNDGPQIEVPDAFLRTIFTADLDGDGSTEWCAIALKWLGEGALGPNLALGLSPRGDELWRYDLPDGEHPHSDFEMVATGDLLGSGEGQWVIAGADGSIHILSIDGGLIDRFNYGAAPSGMALANLDGRPALLVSTEKSVEAWQFERLGKVDADDSQPR